MPIVNAKMSPDGKKKKLVWNDNGTMKLEDTSAGGLPSVTSSDNGKVLGVDSGEWAVVSPPSSLPSVNSEDAGKVLTVSDDGVWEAETPSGGGDVLNVTDNWIIDTSGDVPEIVHTLNKTYSEIKSAYLAGVSIIVALTATSEEDNTTVEQAIYGRVVAVEDVAENDVVTVARCYITGVNADYIQVFEGTSLSSYPHWNQIMS